MTDWLTSKHAVDILRLQLNPEHKIQFQNYEMH